MKNKVQDGKTIVYTVKGKPVKPDTLVVLGGMVGIPVTGGRAGEPITLQVEGVFTLPKTTGTIEQGQAVYADTSVSPPVVTTEQLIPGTPADPSDPESVEVPDTYRVKVGHVWEDSTDDTVDVKINV